MGACQGKEPSPTPHPPPRQRQWEPVPSLPDAGGRARHHLAPLQLCQPPPPSRDQACQAAQPSQNSLCPHSILPKGTSTSPSPGPEPSPVQGWGSGGSHHSAPPMALDSELWAEEQVGDGQKQGLGQGPSILIVVLSLLGTEHPGATSVVAGQGEGAPRPRGGRRMGSEPRQALWAEG